ncbi:MAG: response regulator transcription factor [Lachnospiraceae bacterium]|jgi:two-component system response regulator VicR|nr:response regulator transcription factor [Lachnospiraceae bacterium]
MNIKDRKILLVDDETEILNFVYKSLDREGFKRIFRASCIKEAVKIFQINKPDLLLLDIMLPDGDGLDFFREIKRCSDVPVIFLTAKDEDTDKLIGLGLGADDYITKPFLVKELIFRVQAVLRRTYHEEAVEDIIINLGDIKINMAENLVYHGKMTIPLTAKEREILFKLYENKNMVVTGDALSEAVWGDELDGYEQSLMMHISRLRSKIEEVPSNPKYLITMKGIGYKLIVG